jgi:glycosyltransferase involved in cell wall biosynthesis
MDALLRARGHVPIRIALCESNMKHHRDVGDASDRVVRYSRYGNKHQLRKKFLLSVKDVDVIISSSFLPIVWRSREDSDIPYVHVEHFEDPNIYAPFVRERSCYDCCVAVNRTVSAHIAHMMGDQAAVRHVRNPFHMPEANEHTPGRVTGEPRQRVVLFVGWVNRDKGADSLLEIASRTTAEHLPYRFEVVGPIRDRRLATKLAATPSVRVHGSLPADAMPGMYRDADIFVLMSRSEAMSYALLEALAAGCEVITMNKNPEAASILQVGTGEAVGHVCADSSEVMHTLRRIADHIPTKEDIHRCRMAVLRYVDNEKTIREYEDIMHEVVETAKRIERPSTVHYPTRLDFPWMPDVPLRLLRSFIHGTSLFRWMRLVKE